jgi:hypothetical protein
VFTARYALSPYIQHYVSSLNDYSSCIVAARECVVNTTEQISTVLWECKTDSRKASPTH